MNRAILSSAIEGVVSSYGYEFNLNDSACYPTTVCRYPAAFMSQPEFSSIEGRKHGRITYTITLHLAQQGAKLSPAERNNLLDEMEQQMLDIFTELSRKECVAVVEGLQISPTSPTIDNHGALAIVGKAKVVTIF
ncbi:MAG: hypothetical protein E7140_02245 [Rikenellaceae bacterium]|nr:hypothetical protein [Rikenellaceae bacterium]